MVIDMAKFCTNCGKELPENAAICVNCGNMIGDNGNNKKEKKKGLPTWAIVLIVIGCVVLIPIIIFAIFAAVGYKYIKDNDINIKDYIEKSMISYGTIGDSLTDYDTRITLTNALIYSDIGGVSTSEEKEYLVFFFEVENVSDDSLYISNHNFNGFLDQKEVPSTISSVEIDGYKPLGEVLSEGESAKGYVAYEIDSDWNNFSIHFRRNSFDYDSIIFDVYNEDDINNNDTNQDGV